MVNCRLCKHEIHNGECEEHTDYDHINGFHECGCPGRTGFLGIWDSAKVSGENGELTSHVHYLNRNPDTGRYEGVVQHGWWVDPHSWSLGISVSCDPSRPSWWSRWSLLVEIGPFTWVLSGEEWA